MPSVAGETKTSKQTKQTKKGGGSIFAHLKAEILVINSVGLGISIYLVTEPRKPNRILVQE